jgi:hypothetical protein
MVAGCGARPSPSAVRAPAHLQATETPVAESTSPSPSPSTPTPPPAVPTPSAAVVASPVITGAVVSPSGANLTSPQVEAPPKASAGTCAAWYDAGWSGDDCGLAAPAPATPSNSLGWAVEHQANASTGLNAWRAFVMTSGDDGQWRIRLVAGDAGGHWSGVKVVSRDLSGSGRPDLVFGYRLLGTSSFLQYDVVDREPGGAPAVVAHRELSHGSATVGSGGLVDYAAEYPGGEPNCCPPYFTMTVLKWSSGAFHVESSSHVAPAAVPASNLG